MDLNKTTELWFRPWARHTGLHKCNYCESRQGERILVNTFKWFTGCEAHSREASDAAEAYMRAHHMIRQIEVELAFPAYIARLRRPFAVRRSSGVTEEGWALEPDSVDAFFWKAGAVWFFMAERPENRIILQKPVAVTEAEVIEWLETKLAA